MSESPRAFQSLSVQQENAWKRDELADPEEVLENIWAVALPIPGGNMTSSFGYAAFTDDGVDIIDSGWDSPEVLEAWKRFLEAKGRTLQNIQRITATHHHPDHLGLAGTLREASGAPVQIARIEDQALRRRLDELDTLTEDVTEQLTGWGVPADVITSILADLGRSSPPRAVEDSMLLEEGDTFQFGHLNLTTIITPGHTAGHACFVDEHEKVIFTGDHVLPGISPGIALGRVGDEDPLIDYVEALHRMTQYDDCDVLPGHEYRFVGLAERSRAIAAHHLRRTRALRDLRGELGNASVWQYAERAPWSRGWHRLGGFLLLSALRQTEQHLFSIEAGRAERWLDSDWPGER